MHFLAKEKYGSRTGDTKQPAVFASVVSMLRMGGSPGNCNSDRPPWAGYERLDTKTGGLDINDVCPGGD